MLLNQCRLQCLSVWYREVKFTKKRNMVVKLGKLEALIIFTCMKKIPICRLIFFFFCHNLKIKVYFLYLPFLLVYFIYFEV